MKIFSEIAVESQAITFKVNYATLASDSSNHQISIYPNPTQDFLLVDLEERIDQVEIIDQLGKTVLIIESDNKQIDVSDLHIGIYFLKVNQTHLMKFIKR